MLTSPSLTKGLFIVLATLATSGFASAQATGQSAKKGGASKSATPEAPEPLKDPSELKLAIIAEVSSITRSPTWDGDITGTVTVFTVAGKAIELDTRDILHEGGKSWIATKKYGKVGIAGGYGPYVGHSDLGSESTNYIPPNTTTVGYTNGLRIWLTPSQRANLKKLL